MTRIMIEEIMSLLDLFESEVTDRESNRLVWEFCNDREKWNKARDLFSTLRDRYLKAAKMGNREKMEQYSFEEVIAKTLYNIRRPAALFDTHSPYLVIKYALSLAKVLNISTKKVVEIVS